MQLNFKNNQIQSKRSKRSRQSESENFYTRKSNQFHDVHERGRKTFIKTNQRNFRAGNLNEFGKFVNSNQAKDSHESQTGIYKSFFFLFLLLLQFCFLFFHFLLLMLSLVLPEL